MIEPNVSPAPSDRVAQIKAVINDFLQERLQSKLEELNKQLEILGPDDEDGKKTLLLKKDALLRQFLPANWIADAAQRVGQIQQVTHALKFSHPDARGSNLYAGGNFSVSANVVGTHTIASCLIPDVVGNAAALDVYKFLRLSVDGKSILSLAVSNDPALAEAFSEDREQAISWVAAFASLIEPKGKPSTHKLAKQVYWPVQGQNYHLLAPLFPTSLVHAVWRQISNDRFSEEAKASRAARRDGLAHPRGYCEYPNVTIQNFGGTKPQNISQLNSERRGENYLLPSFPPNWKSSDVRVPLGVRSVFDKIIGSRPRLRELVRILKDFLASIEHADTNIRIRNKRAELTGLICDEVYQFAAELRKFEPGWSSLPECQLDNSEQCWLDPERAMMDADFASLRQRGDWQDEICRRFGNWLNVRLTSAQTQMSEVEAAHWRDVLNDEIRLMRNEVVNDE